MRGASSITSARYSLASIVGESPGIKEAKERVKMVASLQVPVHIYGATGTGKELFAHALHEESNRRDMAFIRINCAAIPETLIESELFGYAEGAFTGARRGGKAGKFELANQGTIFLDEVSELSWAAQAKLLRVLEDSEIERVGDVAPIRVDVRVISASNQSLNQLALEGKFRKDLLFRLNVFTIAIPPLRERLDDIPRLVESFIKAYNRENGTDISGFKSDAIQILNTYHWPGNVRELFTAVERACIDAGSGYITSGNLLRFTGLAPQKNDVESDYMGFDLRQARAEAERETILRALRASGHNRSQAAELLGLSRSALYQKMKQLNIERNK
ncbi:MAG: sigma 54-interacting transcriptional regulator [Syntrophomonadaceae bacterium]|nr:sigma 54-interacting transcriptional regulator [Syntrophomonadaceae bacterium]